MKKIIVSLLLCSTMANAGFFKSIKSTSETVLVVGSGALLLESLRDMYYTPEKWPLHAVCATASAGFCWYWGLRSWESFIEQEDEKSRQNFTDKYSKEDFLRRVAALENARETGL